MRRVIIYTALLAGGALALAGCGTADNHSLMLKQIAQLGGKSYERWLGEWAQRWRDGEPIAVLVDRDATHCVVIRTR